VLALFIKLLAEKQELGNLQGLALQLGFMPEPLTLYQENHDVWFC